MQPGLFIEIYVMSAVITFYKCDCSVLNSLGGIIDQLYCTAEFVVPVIMWLLIQLRIYTTLCKEDICFNSLILQGKHLKSF